MQITPRYFGPVFTVAGMRRLVSQGIALLFGALATVGGIESVTSETDPEHEANLRRQANLLAVETWTGEQQRALAADEGDRRVWPGVLADRTRRQVVVRAEATGIEGNNAIEFVLISQQSGHDYEALATALATPSDIHAALEFIGMDPGIAVDPAQQRFWPRGERVWITFEWAPIIDPEIDPLPRRAKVETLLFNLRTDNTLPVEGFVFTGSAERPHPQTGETVYAADVFGPNSVAAVYNEPFSVLDVPRRAPQSEIYGAITPNPDALLPAGELLTVVLEPEYPAGRQRVLSAQLKINAAADSGPDTGLKDLRFTITPDSPEDPAPLLEDAHFIGLLAWLGRVTDGGRDPFITLQPDTRLPWGVLRDCYRMLEAIEDANGIRIEPPAAGQFYYRALLPSDWFRDRETRTAHPDELHLKPDPDNPDLIAGAVWEWFEEKWPDDHTLDAKVTAHQIPVGSPSELLEKQIKQQYEPRPAVLLLFTPEKVTLNALNQWMRPLQGRYPTQYVFGSHSRP